LLFGLLYPAERPHIGFYILAICMNELASYDISLLNDTITTTSS
jgi:hypothetical protein